MILLIRSNAIFNDPRVEKYLSYLNSNNIEYKILGWDRNAENLEYKNCIYFRKKSGYNVGGLKAAWNRILWMLFCLRQINRIRPSFIHGCDLDAAFPAIIYKLFRKRKIKVLFDVFDWFSATLYNQPQIITTAFNQMESLTTKNSDYIIICEKERLEQIPFDISTKVDILPNIPLIQDDKTFKNIDNNLVFANNKITLSYVGGLYNERFLNELLDCAEQGYVNLLIAGYGDNNLEERCRNLSKKENIKYFGRVSYEQGLHISTNSDIVFAMYCKTNPNHIYAAPNKYYEAMLLGKPIITTKGTIVGDKVVSNKIGFAIEEDIDELKKLIASLQNNHNIIKESGHNAKNLWITKYSTYTQDFLNTKYREIIES